TCSVFFLIDPSTTEIYTLSLHDALPIWLRVAPAHGVDEARLWHLHDRQSPFAAERSLRADRRAVHRDGSDRRDDEPDVFREPREIGRDTSELQSRGHLVCRLLLEKKKNK